MNSPYGGLLVDLIVGPERAAEMKASAKDYPSQTLDERAICDLELLSVGGYSPLKTFMNKADYDRVVKEQRLADGTLWPLPIVLPVTPGEGVAVGKALALRDVYGNLLAFLHIEDLYEPDKQAEAEHAYGSLDKKHPSVAYLDRIPNHYATGRLEVLRIPPHYDFVELRRTPRELREHFESQGWSKIVAFQTRDPLHRAHEEFTKRAAEQIGGGLLIHPVVGVTKPGDVDHYTRVRCYRALVDNYYDKGTAALSLLPLAMRMAGPREVLLHAIIRRNYGCTDFIVGRDHAGPGKDSTGKPFYEPYAAQEAMAKYKDEIGMGMVEFKQMVFLPDEDRYAPVDEVPAGVKTADISDAQVRDDYLAKGLQLPEWFIRPAVAEILSETNPPAFRQGLTIWFTGLSGSGKSTVAQALVERLAEYGRNCSFLDGDEIRTHLSKGLSFSKEDRDINIRRVGYVAGMVAQHGGTTLCSVISPYKTIRDEARKQSRGNFVEVYCSTPIDVCENRDVKGMYAKARAAVAEGKPMGFTGIDDPYEAPENPEVTLDTGALGVAECVDKIIEKLLALGYILPHGHISA
ncbi:MAG: bifunctional sulfate adenylyltransferase/adenylylsulfate kinase [Paludisphaera borealis]|uniref:bifunctional sulfate adenylyltransferase/adenylylsulfate kinase n=1 Tax=Paludisphaera borealis TaxID=1387353 RepID=UPI00284BF7EA|nr:bifunctional sulfate adenylyltransferase/adenylylsulfate kinase [Paludisphaera borealis]MDR3619047.1 bifunctional sulfate adenylyltransferase/adenylylsulfate kinase [Paludisphaera borealis]